jgi:DNA-directed RNA polymerase specialized sigma subunit
MKNKSKKYQYKIVEVSFDQAHLNNFSEERGISNILIERSMSDKIIELREELLNEIYNIVFGPDLTEHQRNVLLMRLDGKTQNEIAQHLGITQSAVHKALHGNIDYKNNKKRYGGVYKKLKKKCMSNENIKEILSKIEIEKRGGSSD